MHRVNSSNQPGLPHRGGGRIRRRRGVVSVLAMVYLVLFATLAIGAYAAITTSAQASYNQRDVNAARAAAESGMEFIRFQLYQLNIPHNTAPTAMFATVFTQLSTALNGTVNMHGDTVGIDPTGTVITIPSRGIANPIDADGTGSKFFVTITQDAQQLVVKTVGIGRSSVSVGRGVQMKYAVAQRASSIFNFGVASNGTISMNGNTSITGATDPTKGSVLSADTVSSTPVTMAGSTLISGDVSMVNSSARISTTGSPTVGGYTPAQNGWSQHVHAGVTAPDFPQIDTSVFQQYATNTYVPGSKTLVNTVIPPNTNPSFLGNTTIQGVLYIQTPNNVTFSGNLTVQGLIVVQNNPTGGTAGNALNFSGNVSASAISTLPANATFPAAERALTNVFLLAPEYKVSFSGNFGTIGGSMIADQFSFTGNAGGTVTGSVVGLADLPMTLSGNSDIIINSTGTTAFPPGVFFGSNYAPLPDTWQEVHP
jgi:Tfp pilus assembly protein PilX